MKVVLDFLAQYGYILAYTALTAIAGVLGAGMKKLYDRMTADDTKRKVVETCVKAVEQLFLFSNNIKDVVLTNICIARPMCFLKKT